MNRRLAFTAYVLLFVSLVFSGCIDNSIIDVNKEIPNTNWSYIKKVSIPVEINDISKPYKLYMNLRHTANYRYSNIFVLIHTIGPDRKRKTERKEFQLAYPDGEWLGSGSANIYSYQLLFGENIIFSAPGKYLFEFEQNMRDNPLREIRDVGLRIEPAE